MTAGPALPADAGAALPADAVVAVIVTMHRREQLQQSLAAMAKQTRPVDHVIVVDNGPDDPAEPVVRNCGLPATYLASRRNLGGAGGFALGMLHALALGAAWVWCADDDGRPADEHVLATLLEAAGRHDLAEVSPIVADIDDPHRLAFPLRRGLRWRRSRHELGQQELLLGYASLFNGALFRAETLDAIGVPDYRLFSRGDETEIHRRLQRSGLRFGTCLRTTYIHPNGAAEFKPILGGRLSAQYPDNEIKRYYTYRNRGYLTAQPGMRWLGPLEWLRFGWYFLVRRRDPAGFRQWLRLHVAGRRERFARRPGS